MRDGSLFSGPLENGELSRFFPMPRIDCTSVERRKKRLLQRLSEVNVSPPNMENRVPL
jgi:hypothetical protein